MSDSRDSDVSSSGSGMSADQARVTLMRRSVRDLRQQHPQAVVQTEPVRLDDRAIAVKATIALPSGARGSGIGGVIVENLETWPAALTDAEALAVLRALESLGSLYEWSSGPERGRQPQRPAAPAGQQPQQVQPQAQPRRVPPPQEGAPPVVNAVRRSGQAPEAEQRPTVTPAVPAPDDIEMATYSWSNFWRAAEARGLTRDQVHEALERPVGELSSRQAVEMLREKGMWS